MAATATQTAKQPRNGAPCTQGAQKEEKRSVKAKLYDLPRSAGIALMALLLVVSLVVGNVRALQNATPGDFIRQGDVQSILEDRIAQAGNVVTVAMRAGLSADLILDVENAMQALEEAKSAKNISRLDQKLTAAVSELTTAQLSGEDAKSMQRAADNFAEQGSFLRQEARSYNEQAKEAEKVYEMLPMKFLLPEVDVYEGI